MSSSIRLSLAVTLTVAVGLTVVFSVSPTLDFSYGSRDAYAAIGTLSIVVAALVGFLLYGRMRDTATRSDLLLFVALSLIALTNLARAVAPAFDGGNNSVIWAPETVRLIAGAMLAAAALAPNARLRNPDRLVAYGWTLLASAAAVGAIVAATSNGLFTGIDPSFSGGDEEQSLFHASGLLLAAELVCMVLFAVASIGFARRAERTGDRLFAWLAIGTGLAAVARLSWILFPAVYANWIFFGDVLRLAAYLAILAGALGEIARLQSRAAKAAVLEERERIARDLHDGLAQDLAFISTEGMRLAEHDQRAADLATVARNTLQGSREAIQDLKSSDGPLDVAIADLATTLVERHGCRLRLELDEDASAGAGARGDLLCIVAESISNAVRHGSATEVRIRLEANNGDGLALTISDNGHDHDPESPVMSQGGFGLAGMRTRVERLGGQFQCASRPGSGTTVEVVLPRQLAEFPAGLS
jgi:signal transduction histidine kinase